MLPREYPNLYFDGRWQEPDSTERFDIISPATGEQIGNVPAANETDIDRAVEAARKAFFETDWPTRPVEERAEIMERLAALIAEHQAEFAQLIVDELGHTKLTAEVYHSVAPTLHWNYYAKIGREHTFAEVRESDLSPLAGNAGGLIMKYEYIRPSSHASGVRTSMRTNTFRSGAVPAGTDEGHRCHHGLPPVSTPTSAIVLVYMSSSWKST